jgi:hypothetical protein
MIAIFVHSLGVPQLQEVSQPYVSIYRTLGVLYGLVQVKKNACQWCNIFLLDPTPWHICALQGFLRLSCALKGDTCSIH